MSHKLKKELEKLNLDYFLIPNNDEFASEYLPEYEKRLEYFTGFTGSNGFAIAGQKKSAFFTDGRYILQSTSEIDSSIYKTFNLSDKKPLKWLLENTKAGDKVGFDPRLHSKNEILLLKNHLIHNGAKMVEIKNNPIDSIWDKRPEKRSEEIFLHEERFSGSSLIEKCNIIINDFPQKTDYLILNDPASICWLFNIRSKDVDCSPLLLCYALIHKDGSKDLFIEENRTNDDTKAYLKTGRVNILKPNRLEEKIKSLKNKTAQIDPKSCNYYLFSLLEKARSSIIEKTNPCLIRKAIKNKTEIKGAIKTHEIDGLSLTKFLFWLDNSIKNKDKISELSAANKLLEFRKENKDFIYPSFDTISGFGSNGAIIHYRVDKKSNKEIKGNSLYLVDSGGQYFSGTTDVTRTICVGTPTEEQIDDFTRVLKGHIALARAKFPRGTKGSDLDALARNHLWQAQKDYDHGTGHGVGSFSSVHESPPSISKRSDGTALQPGMILSNEPGYYKKGEYGIRIESLMLVEEIDDKFLKFRTLTLAPIDHKLIDFKMLTYPEKKWIRNYHEEIYDKFKNDLSEEEISWIRPLHNLKFGGIYRR